MKILNAVHVGGVNGPGQMLEGFMAAVVVSCMLLVSCAVPKEPAQDTRICRNPLSRPSIIILSDKKGLAWNVAGYLERYYDQKNFLVRNILFSDFPRYKDLAPVAVIYLNVGEHSQIQPDTRLRGKDETPPGGPARFISIVGGRDRDKERRLVDGISGASEMADAVPIAERIIKTADQQLNSPDFP